MLASTLGTSLLLHSDYGPLLDGILGGHLIVVFEFTGIAISMGVLVFLLRFTSRYERSLDELSEARRQIQEQTARLAQRNVGLEKSSGEQTHELTEKLEELEQSRTAMLSVLEDLTETRDEIEQAKAFDDAILSSLVDGVIVLDVNGIVTRVNQATKDIAGLGATDPIGKKSSDAFHLVDAEGKDIPVARRQSTRILEAGAAAKPIRENNMQLKRPDGRLVPLDIEASPIITGGRLTAIVILIRDVTEQRRIDRSKSEFVSLASHQLRTPLTAIAWYTELLLDDPNGHYTPEEREYLNEVHQSNRRMIDLVDSLLNVSRIEMGSIRVEPEPLDLEQFVHAEISGLAPLVRARNITVQTDLTPGLPSYSADPKLMAIIMQNLLTNAVKYTPPNGTITVGLHINDGNYIFSVSDTGIGIPPEVRQHVFDKLYRADNARIMVPEGSGLGLYLVKSIVEQVGGSITFTSEVGRGSTFTVSLPREGMKARASEQSVISNTVNG